ncbi:hypothetical protein ABTY59_37445 [Streptomyces sp. NPDC096079]|uniref:hypothetical protein n=1 Tax=Streptomyces sp. NPDC096079 TaxID=3155820 RepID=UPI003331230C
MEPRLQITYGGRPLLDGTLAYLALRARAMMSPEVFPPFTYQDPIDPENPDADRPIRRARLIIEELEVPNVPVRSQNSDGSWGVEMLTRSEWERRRPKEMDE